MYMYMDIFVCKREREREKASKRERERESEAVSDAAVLLARLSFWRARPQRLQHIRACHLDARPPAAGSLGALGCRG